MKVLPAHPPRRFGNVVAYNDQASEVHRSVDAMRGWVRDEIVTLRNDLEARILKQMDLREQLLREVDELIPQAVGGVVPGVEYAPAQHAASYHVSAITDMFDEVFYPVDDEGNFDFSDPLTSTPNPAFPTLLDDAPTHEEDWTALG